MKRYKKYKTIFYVNVHCLKKVITSNDTENKSLQLQAKSIGQIIMMAIYELIFYCHLVLLVVICFVVIGNPSQVYAHSHLYSNNTTMLLPHIHFCIIFLNYCVCRQNFNFIRFNFFCKKFESKKMKLSFFF